MVDLLMSDDRTQKTDDLTALNDAELQAELDKIKQNWMRNSQRLNESFNGNELVNLKTAGEDLFNALNKALTGGKRSYSDYSFKIGDKHSHLRRVNDNTVVGEAQPVDGVAGYDAVLLDDLNDEKFVEYALKRAADSPAIASSLAIGLASTFGQAATPADVPAQISDATSALIGIPLWRDRKRGISAAQFIQNNYGLMRNGEWYHNGIARADLKNNPGLYNAYTAWIADHPGDKLDFFPEGGKRPGRPRKPDADESRRTRDRERKREGKKLRQPDACLK